MKKNNKKRMRKNERRMIAILVCITIIVIGVFFAINRKNTNSNENSGTSISNNNNEQKENEVTEEFVEKLADGTRLNKSSKIAETKTVDGLEISDIQISEKNGETQFIATVKNVSGQTKEGAKIKLKIVDKDGNELKTLEPYIGKLEAGQSQKTSANGSSEDYANAYDIIASKE